MADKQTQESWLGQVREPIIDADRPICDPHHHLWDHESNPYLLPELLADTGDGHNVVSTVFMECGSMYRAEGPVAEAPIGETEFVNGIAAMSASGQYGPARACAGIVGFADLSLGVNVGPYSMRIWRCREGFAAYATQQVGMLVTLCVILIPTHLALIGR